MKSSRIAGVLLGLSVLLLAGCSSKPREAEAAWMKDWTSGDPEKILSHYADDASVEVPGSPVFVMNGRDAIRNGLRVILADKQMSLTFSPSGQQEGELVRHGAYSLTRTNPTEITRGYYFTIYRKLPGGSRVVAHQAFVGHDWRLSPGPVPRIDVGSLRHVSQRSLSDHA
jgi:ketosteroid isomerase-like protein